LESFLVSGARTGASRLRSSGLESFISAAAGTMAAGVAAGDYCQ
jgi:hypothetical protein